MARRKSDSVKWTLVLVLVIFSHIVVSRPQVELPSTTLSVLNITTNKPTESSIRYSYYQNNRFKSPLPYLTHHITNDAVLNSFKVVNPNSIITSNISNRTSRLIGRKNNIQQNNPTQRKPSVLRGDNFNSLIDRESLIQIPISKKDNTKSNIRRVITKWTDNANFEHLDISHDNSISNERDAINYENLVNVNVNHEFSTGTIKDSDENTKSQQLTQSNHKRLSYAYNKPRPQYSEETQLYSDNFHVIHNPYSHATRPTYIFSTPSPTPVITNVGYPKPWPNHNFQPPKKPTRKPIKSTTPTYSYNYHNPVNNVSPYPGNNFEVTTFPPAGVNTDRIVIRPEEYSASPEDCPTIFLTLNNTFQGQGKEVCPDLNIAVNTNVINKNVVIESDEGADTTLTDIFGLPSDDESSSDEVSNDYAESQENVDDTESESLEGLGLSNYNAASNSESSESDNFESPSSALTTYTKPSQQTDTDDDVFSFSALIDFFRPAVGAFNWLAAISPISFGAISFFLAPLVLLFAGASGLVTVFAPWVLSGREVQQPLYRPKWQWDNNFKSWYVDSMPNNNRWAEKPRKSVSNYKIGSIRPTWFNNIKEFIKILTNNLKKTGKIKAMKRK